MDYLCSCHGRNPTQSAKSRHHKRYPSTTSEETRHVLVRSLRTDVDTVRPFLACSRRQHQGGNEPAHDTPTTPQPLATSSRGHVKVGDLSTVWWACVWQGQLRIYRHMGDAHPKVRIGFATRHRKRWRGMCVVAVAAAVWWWKQAVARVSSRNRGGDSRNEI